MLRRTAGAVAYQSTQLTSRAPEGVLEDLAALDVTGVRLSERGRTYVVFSPAMRQTYTVSLAVTLAIIIAIGDLVATAASVVWIVFLPLALLPFVPLLLDDRPQCAVGAVPGEEDRDVATRVTAHGRVWGDLGAALDAYLGNLPALQGEPSFRAGDHGEVDEDPVDDSAWEVEAERLRAGLRSALGGSSIGSRPAADAARSEGGGGPAGGAPAVGDHAPEGEGGEAPGAGT